MKKQVVFGSRVGNRWSFAVEFEAFSEQPRMWNEWWGSLWLWADGYVVGRPAEIEMVMCGFDPLLASIHQTEQNTENPTSALLASLPANQALEWVMWAQCREDDPPKDFHGDEALLAVHEVLPRGSPFFDGWEAILIPAGSEERFIFRQSGREVIEAKWSIGTFKELVMQARDEFRRLAIACMMPPSLQ